MVAHLEHAIGILCLGGMAAAAVYTIVETVQLNWQRIKEALWDHPEGFAFAGLGFCSVRYEYQDRYTGERNHQPANQKLSHHCASPCLTILESPDARNAAAVPAAESTSYDSDRGLFWHSKAPVRLSGLLQLILGDRHQHHASELHGAGPGARTGACDHCGKMVRE